MQSNSDKHTRLPHPGVVVAALVVGLAYLFGSFIPRHEWFIAPVGVACLAGAYWLGLRRSRSVTPARRTGSAMSWSIVVIAAMALPPIVRWTWLQRELRSIPIPADAYDVQRQTRVVYWTEYPGPYNVKYVTRQSFNDTDRFITSEFKENGWKVGGRHRVETYAATEGPSIAVAERFRRQPKAGRLRNYTMIRANRWMNVTLFDAGEERLVLCDTHGELPPESIRQFWR